MTYAEAVAVLSGALRFGINPSLERIRQLCEALGSPQDGFRVVQVAGTNGKTSTARYTAALLHGEGLRTGLYTSPDLGRYPQRMEIDGRIVADEDFAAAVGAASAAAAAMDEVTEFELLTAAALWLFRERGVEACVLEAGLGGRWDATSVASADVAVITGVGLEHTAILGDTLEKIAAEKAAIIRPGALAAVLGPGTTATEAVFVRQAAAAGVPVTSVREDGGPETAPDASAVRYAVARSPHAPGGATVTRVVTPLHTYDALSVIGPSYQAPNVATAVAAAEALLGRRLPQAAEALAGTPVPGRFELVSSDPSVVVDGAHNPQAAKVLAHAIREAWPDAAARPCIVLGVLADKDAAGIVAALAPVASSFVVTASRSQRALPAGELAEAVRAVSGTEPTVVDGVSDAIAHAVGACPAGVIVTGSLSTAGEAVPLR